MPIDPNQLPQDADTLRKIVLDLAAQLDRAFAEQHKYENLLRELLEAQRNRKSEQLSKEQLALFEVAWQARNPEDESAADEDDDDFGNDAPGSQKSEQTPNRKRGGRQPLARHLIREHEPITSAAIRYRIRHYARLAGISTKVIGAHAFRHSHASRQVDAGANIKVVSEILGHRSSSSTRRMRRRDSARSTSTVPRSRSIG